VTFNPWTFLFEVLNFLVLAYVLHRLLYRPLREAIEKRKVANEQALTAAAAARKAADAAEAQFAAKLADADRERTEILRKAAEQAEADRAKRLVDAESAAKSLREQAQLRNDYSLRPVMCPSTINSSAGWWKRCTL
jgi:F-type H+-transporting ATPase subunit b